MIFAAPISSVGRGSARRAAELLLSVLIGASPSYKRVLLGEILKYVSDSDAKVAEESAARVSPVNLADMKLWEKCPDLVAASAVVSLRVTGVTAPITSGLLLGAPKRILDAYRDVVGELVEAGIVSRKDGLEISYTPEALALAALALVARKALPKPPASIVGENPGAKIQVTAPSPRDVLSALMWLHYLSRPWLFIEDLRYRVEEEMGFKLLDARVDDWVLRATMLAGGVKLPVEHRLGYPYSYGDVVQAVDEALSMFSRKKAVVKGPDGRLHVVIPVYGSGGVVELLGVLRRDHVLLYPLTLKGVLSLANTFCSSDTDISDIKAMLAGEKVLGKRLRVPDDFDRMVAGRLLCTGKLEIIRAIARKEKGFGTAYKAIYASSTGPKTGCGNTPWEALANLLMGYDHGREAAELIDTLADTMDKLLEKGMKPRKGREEELYKLIKQLKTDKLVKQLVEKMRIMKIVEIGGAPAIVDNSYTVAVSTRPVLREGVSLRDGRVETVILATDKEGILACIGRNGEARRGKKPYAVAVIVDGKEYAFYDEELARTIAEILWRAEKTMYTTSGDAAVVWAKLKSRAYIGVVFEKRN